MLPYFPLFQYTITVMKILLFLLLLPIGSMLFAQVNPVDKNGLALGGYDLVAYFESEKAIKGNPTYASKVEGITYYFASFENQQKFLNKPKDYLPQYDGYCALAVSYGKKISINPQTFKIKDGKLYLFFNGKTGNGLVNSLSAWNKNEERLLKKANGNWPEVQKSKFKPEDSL